MTIAGISTIADQQALVAKVNTDVTEAPVDGQLYARKDEDWEPIIGGGGGGGREVLTGNRTYYVSASGANANDGLTVGAPFLTIQYAYNLICDTLDCAGFGVTIQIAAGTYAAGLVVTKSPFNINASGYVTIKGQATITDVHVNAANGFILRGPSRFYLQNMQITASATAVGASFGARVDVLNVRCNGSALGFTAADAGTYLSMAVGCSMNGAYAIAFNATYGALIVASNFTVVGTPAASMAFAAAERHGTIHFEQLPTGAGTGKRFQLATGGKITFSPAYTDTSLPGSIAGTVDANGSYYGTFPGAAVTSVSDTAPASPTSGQLWFDSTTGNLFIYYMDGTSNQWVQVGGA